MLIYFKVKYTFKKYIIMQCQTNHSFSAKPMFFFKFDLLHLK
jgi:hypothetical protein